MKLIQDTVGTIIFKLTTDSYDGEIIETVDEKEPFEFVFGKGVMLKSFEEKLEGLTIGEEFKFILPKQEAYGIYMPEMIIELEKQFLIDEMKDPEVIEEELQVDNFIPMLDPEGNTLSGKILEIGDEMVKLDFNHPLADMDLYFTGKVIDLRPASAVEIKDGKVFNHTEWVDAGPDEPQVCSY